MHAQNRPCPPVPPSGGYGFPAAAGENLAIARIRRRESQRVWARRIGISVPTLIRMERGDPGVAMGIYATALWLMNRANALPDLASPAEDKGALELDGWKEHFSGCGVTAGDIEQYAAQIDRPFLEHQRSEYL